MTTYQDNKWSLAVKERDNFRCRRRGSTYDLHSHHIFTRGRQSTRLDLENGITICKFCHEYAHHEKDLFLKWIEEIMGTEKYKKLYRKSWTMTKGIDDKLK